MKEGKSSFSAEVMAFYRATESAKPETERLYYDPLARGFLRSPLRLLTGSGLVAGMIIWFFTDRWIPGGAGIVLARSRYIDDLLEDCLTEGMGQLVILGAGYDSRAYRFSELRTKVKVFEVDHPATQIVKVKKVTRLLGSLPSHVVYSPVNLMRGTLDKRLLDSGYDRSLKTLFILEGVSYYLSARAMDEILAFVASNSAKGSSVVFDYFVYLSADEARECGISQKRLLRIAQSARRSGEPVLFRMHPESVESYLSARGLQLQANVTARDFRRLYFKGRSQSRKLSPHLAVAYATVY